MMSKPRPKKNQLKVQWGYTKSDGGDIYYANGEGTSKADAKLAHWVLSCPRRSGDEFLPSFIDELRIRGYDISTFKLTIDKKVVEDE